MAVAELDELFHPLGWVVGVDGVAAGHVQDREDLDLVVADPLAELGHGGRAEAFDGADRVGGSAFGVGVEVVGVDEDVEPDLPGRLLGDCWAAEDGGGGRGWLVRWRGW